MAWNDDLSGVQLEIAKYPGTPLRVLAGPGTGKTYSLMRRVARLLEGGTAPDSILAVTFTRTAAQDLVDKLSLLNAPGADQVRACTLHSLCFGILAQNAVLAATGRTPRPLLAHEVDAAIADLSLEFNGHKKPVKALLKAFEAYWATLQHMEPGWPASSDDQRFDRALKGWLLFHDAMLVGEVVPLALDFLRQNPGSPYVPAFTHVVADEYQDLNKADQEVIEALCDGSVTVVGDEDQSIYSFRYAHPVGITDYHLSHAGTHDEQLIECRRCPTKVVTMATDLIRHNERAHDSVIVPAQTNPEGKVYIVQHNSSASESKNIAEFIDWYLERNPDTRPGEVLILTTRRKIGYAIRSRLTEIQQAKSRHWMAHSFYFEEALETDAAREAFCLLALRASPDDRPALRAWLAIGKQDGRARGYARLRQHCEEAAAHPRAVLNQLADGELTLPYTANITARYKLLRDRLAEIGDLTGLELVEAVLPADAVDTVDLRTAALAAAAVAQEPATLVNELRTLITQPELPSESDEVIRIMSLHKSKGLTAKAVVVAGCVAGALPAIDSRLDPAEQARAIEEQRRLFYVALTRTTDTLLISSAATMPFGEASQARLTIVRRFQWQAVLQASQFIAELGSAAPKTVGEAVWRTNLGF